MKLGLAIRELHRSEKSLGRALLTAADRHKVNHEIHHVARDLAVWSQEHVHELSAMGRRYGLKLDDTAPENPPAIATALSRVSEFAGRRPEPALLLLIDLRRLHRKAAGASLDWELLGQGAQAAKDAELLALTKRCHPQTLRQMKWSNSMLKILSPQVLMN